MKRSTWVWTGVAALVVAGGVIGMTRSKDDAPKWRTAKVDTGDIRQRISATGILNPVVSVTVGSQVSGTISALYADFNSQVKAGQPIAQIDPSLIETQLVNDQANLRAATAKAEDAKRQMDRGKRLFDGKLMAEQDYQTLVTAYQQALGSQAGAQAAVEKDRTNIGYCTIKAPVAGTVISRAVDVGQTVAASFATPNLFVIGKDLTKMQVFATIDEADIGGVKDGQPALFTVDAFPDTQFKGAVGQVRLQPTTTNNVVTYTVVVNVPNDDLKLLPGMTANITIMTAHQSHVLRVPNAALRFNPAAFLPEAKSQRPAGGVPGGPGAMQAKRDAGHVVKRDDHVWALDAAGKPKQVPVTLGISDGQFTEVSGEGVSEGLAVIVGVEDLSKGAKSAQNTPIGGGMPGGGPRR
ncbi:MAG TPA: efflux RND transporter periplasmic adaptor subunit [Holophagaceae bacterium]|jgi:HlyD family secretion protein|nr:efflux RND transporter periplasmic adaptor subunit [Holophagaceae bacterium]